MYICRRYSRERSVMAVEVENALANDRESVFRSTLHANTFALFNNVQSNHLALTFLLHCINATKRAVCEQSLQEAKANKTLALQCAPFVHPVALPLSLSTDMSKRTILQTLLNEMAVAFERLRDAWDAKTVEKRPS